jgi:hypothetical protein
LQGFLRAAQGIRTHGLLHGKQGVCFPVGAHKRDAERTKRGQHERPPPGTRTDREAADAADLFGQTGEPRITAMMLGGMKPPLTTSGVAPAKRLDGEEYIRAGVARRAKRKSWP